jgi:hypothetical protein
MSDEKCEESSYGLLYFIYSFIKKFEKNEFNINKEFLANSFMDIRNYLMDLLESLRDVEKIITKANLAKECAVICEILNMIPVTKVFKMGKNLKVEKGDHGLEFENIGLDMHGESDEEDNNTNEV